MNSKSMKTMAIMIGIPGSGKSTFCKTKLSDYVYVNLDTLHTRKKEQSLIDKSFRLNKNIAIDNTNPTRLDRYKYILQAKENGYLVVGYYLESKFEECMIRNSKREGKAKLPYKALASIAKRMELPDYDENYDELFYVHIINDEFLVEGWRKNEI